MDDYTAYQTRLTLDMRQLYRDRQDLEEKILMQVWLMRDEGMSWAKIGLAMSMTAQSAWERFSGRERDSEIPRSLVDVPLPDL